VAPGHVVLEEVVELYGCDVPSASVGGRSEGTLCRSLSALSEGELEEAQAWHEE
jgi:hypothetical protein